MILNNADTTDQATTSARAAPDLLRLTVDLDAIAENYLYLKKKVAPAADCAAAVKADAYGLGVAQVAPVLHAQGCRHFFVAHLEEAQTVLGALAPARAAGLPGQDVTVYILSGLVGAPLADFAADDLVPVLNTAEDIQRWSDFAGKQDRRLPAVLHIDTGMNRLGLSTAETTALAADKSPLAALDLKYIMSHLACADEAQDPRNAAQLTAFKAAIAQLDLAARYSLANSGGVFLGPEYYFDLIRPGAALYGINGAIGGAIQLQPAAYLQARILQIRKIDSPGTVGYGASHAIAPPAQCATISVGYADGYLRSLSNRSKVFIAGQKCPVVGRVSMDLITVDISALKETPVVGAWADIICAEQTVDDIARDAQTIGYEIFTRLGARIKREYKGSV